MIVLVIEDEPDIQFLISTIFALDYRFSVSGAASSAEEAIEMARSLQPGLILLDHGLAGELTGIDAAPRLKEASPQSKIILFTADASLRLQAQGESVIDAFLVKTKIWELLPTAQRITGLRAPS